MTALAYCDPLGTYTETEAILNTRGLVVLVMRLNHDRISAEVRSRAPGRAASNRAPDRTMVLTHAESPAAGLGTPAAHQWLERDVLGIVRDDATWPPIEDCTLLVE